MLNKAKNEDFFDVNQARERAKEKTKGITLIALVITIIVLLILVAVSIATLTGENGILSKANTAGEQTKDAEEDERVKLAVSTALSDNLGEGLTTESLKNAIGNEFGEDKKDKLTGTGPWKYEGERKDYTIETTGKITETAKGSQEETGTGKTVAELYDGVNNPDEVNYKEDAMHIGDYVNYDAGAWEETKEAPTSENPFEFGGYTAGHSRNEEVSGGSSGGTLYKGWRIWDVSEDKSTVTLISAGCPELYYHQFGTNYAYNSEKILTGKTAGIIDEEQKSDPRDWNSDYVRGNGASARVMTKSDLDIWYNKYIDGSVENSYNIESFPKNTENKLISVVACEQYYWLCSTKDGGKLDLVHSYFRCVSNSANGVNGVRVLVSLKSGVKFNDTPTKETHDNFEYNRWSIE